MRERLNWIDWLKVVVVVGAFLFHAAQPFVYTAAGTPASWLIYDTDKSLLLSLLSGFGYLFGMPLMFFLAGAATWLAVEKRGIGGHTGLRLQRLLIPLVMGLGYFGARHVNRMRQGIAEVHHYFILIAVIGLLAFITWNFAPIW